MTAQPTGTTDFQKETLRLQKQLLESQLELEKLEHEVEVQKLVSKLKELQEEKLTLNTLLRERDEIEDTQIGSPSDRDLTASVNSMQSGFTDLMSPIVSLESSTHTVYYQQNTNPNNLESFQAFNPYKKQ